MERKRAPWIRSNDMGVGVELRITRLREDNARRSGLAGHHHAKGAVKRRLHLSSARFAGDASDNRMLRWVPVCIVEWAEFGRAHLWSFIAR